MAGNQFFAWLGWVAGNQFFAWLGWVAENQFCAWSGTRPSSMPGTSSVPGGSLGRPFAKCASRKVVPVLPWPGNVSR